MYCIADLLWYITAICNVTPFCVRVNTSIYISNKSEETIHARSTVTQYSIKPNLFGHYRHVIRRTHRSIPLTSPNIYCHAVLYKPKHVPTLSPKYRNTTDRPFCTTYTSIYTSNKSEDMIHASSIVMLYSTNPNLFGHYVQSTETRPIALLYDIHIDVYL